MQITFQLLFDDVFAYGVYYIYTSLGELGYTFAIYFWVWVYYADVYILYACLDDSFSTWRGFSKMRARLE